MFRFAGFPRERLIHAFAMSVDGRAKTKDGADLLAKYEKTRAYRSLTADKAARTREKRAAAKANPPPVEPPPVEPPPVNP